MGPFVRLCGSRFCIADRGQVAERFRCQIHCLSHTVVESHVEEVWAADGGFDNVKDHRLPHSSGGILRGGSWAQTRLRVSVNSKRYNAAHSLTRDDARLGRYPFSVSVFGFARDSPGRSGPANNPAPAEES